MNLSKNIYVLFLARLHLNVFLTVKSANVIASEILSLGLGLQLSNILFIDYTIEDSFDWLDKTQTTFEQDLHK